MAKVTTQLEALRSIFDGYAKDGVALSPSIIGVFAKTIEEITADARKLERMLERRLTSADISQASAQRLSADIIDFPKRMRAPPPRSGGDVA
ncbi:MAG: hypothetical protein WBP38_12810 [Hyphomicrobium sp.]|nr:hypothetical protein [Hyphomicrobium sp.]